MENGIIKWWSPTVFLFLQKQDDFLLPSSQLGMMSTNVFIATFLTCNSSSLSSSYTSDISKVEVKEGLGRGEGFENTVKTPTTYLIYHVYKNVGLHCKLHCVQYFKHWLCYNPDCWISASIDSFTLPFILHHDIQYINLINHVTVDIYILFYIITIEF